MRALTVWQPYASAIIAGVKLIENRVWRRRVPKGGEWLGIHAGSRLFRGNGDDFARDMRVLGGWRNMPVLNELPRRALLGFAHLAEVTRCDALPADVANDTRRSWWANGPWCWFFDQVVPLPEPVPMAGAQQLWQIPMEMLDDSVIRDLQVVGAI